MATRSLSDSTGKAGRLSLLLVSESHSASHWLPPQGRLVLGRDAGCDLPVNEPSISRQHLAIHLGDGIVVEDLGSSNGTVVRGGRIRPGEMVSIAVGEPISAGKMLLVLQRQNVSTERRLWMHGYFESRVEEECLRAERMHTQLGLLRVHAPAHAAQEVEETLAAVVRLVDVIAVYGPGEYEVLLPDTPPEGAALVASRLSERLHDTARPHAVGLACYPRDSTSAHALMARAEAATRNAVRPGSADEKSPPMGADGSAGQAMKALTAVIKRVATSDISILVLGETGVGKERLAELVHNSSKRAAKAFLRINCAALSESLLENELFGHERGAFTGADHAKAGLLETANGGTVFLDELAEMPLAIQAKLLRVLEERKVMRLGGLAPRPIDVRLVAATNRDLETEVGRGTFRQDLFFRLNGVLVIIPPLRERIDEIGPLARQFIAEASARAEKPPVKLSREALTALQSYRWPGNIRELRNVIERGVLLCNDDELTLEHLPAEKMAGTFVARQTPLAQAMAEVRPLSAPSPAPFPSSPSRTPTGMPFSSAPSGSHQVAPTSAPELTPPARDSGRFSPPTPHASVTEPRTPNAPSPGATARLTSTQLKALVDQHERAHIEDALVKCAGNQTEAARMLGVSRRTLVNRIIKHQLPRPRKKGS